MRSAAAPLAAILIVAGCNATASSVSVLPDPKLTPGDTLPVTTQELCVNRRDLQGRRHWSREQANETLRRYHLPPGPYGRDFEQDHLVPICMSGSDDQSNLWMQPRRSLEPVWNAERKDELEARMCQMVCAGDLDLTTAQEAIRKDWIVAYQRYIGEPR
jgi:hypothetical protein